MRSLRSCIVAMALIACASPSTAVDPVWGKQPCAHCHMLVSEPRTAAQLVTPAGDRLYFDDVGCLVDHVSRHAPELAHAWVRNERGQWIDALRTHYRAGEATPMGYGFVADDEGSLDFEQLRREVAQKRVARSAL